jgi:hypothetical protein
MIDDGVLIKKDESLSVNDSMKDTIDKFLTFLDSKGELKRIKT